MIVPVVLYIIPWCLMCEKVKRDLLGPYVRRRMISLLIQRIGISKMMSGDLSAEMYDYAFLYDETGRAITPTIKIGKGIFLQAMTYSEFEKAFSDELRKVMSHA